jgi:hypothetical protein
MATLKSMCLQVLVQDFLDDDDCDNDDDMATAMMVNIIQMYVKVFLYEFKNLQGLSCAF